MRITLEREEADVGADLALHWRYAMSVDGGGSPTVTRGVTRCDPAGGAEDPWFALLSRLMQVRPTRVTWRLPRLMEEGVRIDGEARFAPSGGGDPLTVARAQWVADGETIETPAGAFRTWRLEYSDALSLAGQTSVHSGTTWWAPGIGVVRWVEQSRGQVIVEMEIVARGSGGVAAR